MEMASTSATPRELLKEILSELNRGAGIQSSAIVSSDGLLVASVMSEDVDAEAFAAMTATMLGAAETAFSELKKGVAERVIVEGSRAKIVAVGAGKDLILVCMSDPSVQLGLILHQIRRSVEKVKKVFA